jgi:uncharacterized protein
MKTRFLNITVAMLVLLAWALPCAAADFKVPPTPDHYVTDSAGALSDATRTKIESELAAYEKSTGHQIIVWIGNSTGDVPLETWTGEAGHQWKIGRHGHDDGAILFLFMQDHKIRIEVGYGLESSLTDASSYRIIQDVIRPRMRAGDVDGAVSSGVSAILTTITPSYSAVTPPPSAETTAPAFATGIFVIVFAIMALLALFTVVLVVMRVVYAMRYGYLIMREGSTKAKADMKSSAFWGGAAGGLITSSSFGGGGGDFDSGFSAGGGDFGGGGASGGW